MHNTFESKIGRVKVQVLLLLRYDIPDLVRHVQKLNRILLHVE
jgi:hypothetical protein